MNEFVNKLLLAEDKFMPEMHVKQPGFTYSACGPFTKNKERIEKFMQTGNTDFIYKNELDKACFQHDMAYGKTKDFAKWTQSNKVLRDKAFRIASDPKCEDYQTGLALIVDKLFNKRSGGSGIVNEPNYELANELHKPIIRKFPFVTEMKFFISIVLVLNMFLKKLKNLLGIKTWKQTFFEYKQTIQ